MKKMICILLTLALALSSVVFGAASVSAAENDTLVIHPALYARDAKVSKEDYSWHYSEQLLQTLPDVTAKVGDIIELTFRMKANSEEVTSVNGIHVMNFYSCNHDTIKNYVIDQERFENDGHLHITDQYYEDGTIAQMKEYGSTITMPSADAAPNDSYRHFAYTASAAFGAGNWEDWNRVFSFTLVADQAGETCLESWLYDIGSFLNNNTNVIVNNYALFDYDVEVNVVGHIHSGSTMIGDVNGNGSVDIDDATTIQLFAAGLCELDETAQKRADVGNDGGVNVDDATMVQLYIANLLTEFPRQSIHT